MRDIKILTIIAGLLLFLLVAPNTTAAKESYGWGYKKSENHTIPDIGKYEGLLDQYNVFYADDSGDKTIYLTFDNGYEAGYTDDVLDVLDETNVPATFFVTGQYVESEPALIKRMAADGHIIGNHSFNHPDFTNMSKRSVQKELEKVETAVADISEQTSMKYVRPPRGTFNEDTLKWTNEFGYINMFWSLAFVDWNTNQQKGWQYAYDQIMEQIHPGAVMLLHTVSSDNAKALKKVIEDLRADGYTFKSLDNLLLKNLLPQSFYKWQ